MCVSSKRCVLQMGKRPRRANVVGAPAPQGKTERFLGRLESAYINVVWNYVQERLSWEMLPWPSRCRVADLRRRPRCRRSRDELHTKDARAALDAPARSSLGFCSTWRFCTEAPCQALKTSSFRQAWCGCWSSEVRPRRESEYIVRFCLLSFIVFTRTRTRIACLSPCHCCLATYFSIPIPYS